MRRVRNTSVESMLCCALGFKEQFSCERVNFPSRISFRFDFLTLLYIDWTNVHISSKPGFSSSPWPRYFTENVLDSSPWSSQFVEAFDFIILMQLSESIRMSVLTVNVHMTDRLELNLSCIIKSLQLMIHNWLQVLNEYFSTEYDSNSIWFVDTVYHSSRVVLLKIWLYLM